MVRREASIEVAISQLILLIELAKLELDGYPQISQRQREILTILMLKGEQRISDLASMLKVTVPTVTGITQNMVKRGIAQRSSDPSDMRVTLIAPTRKGEELIIAPIVSFVSKLDSQEVEALSGIVDVLDGMHRRMM